MYVYIYIIVVDPYLVIPKTRGLVHPSYKQTKPTWSRQVTCRALLGTPPWANGCAEVTGTLKVAGRG